MISDQINHCLLKEANSEKRKIITNQLVKDLLVPPQISPLSLPLASYVTYDKSTSVFSFPIHKMSLLIVQTTYWEN